MHKTVGHLTLQSDMDGLVSLQCSRCKARFKMGCRYLNEELSGQVFCPICGMPDELTHFYPEEVLEAAREAAVNAAHEEIAKALQAAFGSHSSSKKSPIKITYKPQNVPRTSREIVTQSRDHAMEPTEASCCKRVFALSANDLIAGYYCPYCGRIVL